MINYLLATPQGRIPFTTERLADFLPTARSHAYPENSYKISYRSYLDAIRNFLSQNLEKLSEIVSHKLGNPFNEIASIDIVAEKHGSDYHPAGVTVHSGSGSCSFVVNVALSDRGRSNLDRDFHNLIRLGEIRPRFVPEAYFKADSIAISENGTTIYSSMFIGEWFDDFHEFHLSACNRENKQRMILWDFGRGYLEMSETQTYEIYKKAAYILTWYYNSDTGEEIFPWHHASGDFVARIRNDSVEVGLITVRQYASRIESELSGSEKIEYLLIFLANLTVRMRLDRLDGTGSTAWAGEPCVKACMAGFWEALHLKVAHGNCDSGLPDRFAEAVRNITPGELAGIFQMVVDSYNQDAPDIPIIAGNLPDHVLQTFLALREIHNLKRP